MFGPCGATLVTYPADFRGNENRVGHRADAAAIEQEEVTKYEAPLLEEVLHI